MFTKGVYGTTLTSAPADRLFSNIIHANIGNTLDQSFLSTLRALLHKRLPPNETMRLTCTRLYCHASDITGASSTQCMTWFTESLPLNISASEYGIHIIYTAHPDAGEKMLEIIRANGNSNRNHLNGYLRRNDLHVFFARKAKALFYTTEDGTHTVIFTDKLELKHFHALQMMIPKYLPRLFDINFYGSNAPRNSNASCNIIPLSEVEATLLKSLGNKSAVEYENLIEEFAKGFDIRSEIIRSKLAGFESAFEKIRIDELNGEIKSCQESYEYHAGQMRETANKMEEYRYILAGLMNAMNEQTGDTELMEYFMHHKNLVIIRVTGTAIELVVNGYADVYDVDAFEQYVSNHRGYMYSHLNPAITKPQMEKLYRAIFGTGDGEGQFKLRMCAAYTADMRNGLRAIQKYVFPTESRTYYPNPHIQSYGCVGTYQGRFQEYMFKKDYISAIAQVAVSARNLNFYDQPVMGSFAENLSKSSISCIEGADGTLYTPLEAIAELERTTAIV